MNEFAKKIRQERINYKMTQNQVANQLGMVESCYAHYEQGRTEPNLDILKKLCLLFNVTADYLIGLENEDGTKINNSIVNSFNGNNNTNNINIKG